MKRLYSLGIIVFTAIVAIYFYNFPLNEDSVWIVYSTQTMLHGATLYTDIVEVNPPLIFILNTIPVFLAELINIKITLAYVIFVLFLSFISISFSRIIFQNTQMFSKVQYYLLQLTLLFTFIILPSKDFGEREHLFMIFVFPYILTMMFQDKITLPKNIMLSITLFAAIGFNLKPHFFLIFIVCETVSFIYHKSFKQLLRPQALIIAFSGIIYLGVIYAFFPEYISFLLPLAVATYSNVFQVSFLELLQKNLYDLLFISTFIIYFFLFAYKRRNLDLIVITSLVFPFLLLYFYQQKGWHYHILPALMFASFAFMYILIYYVKKENYKFAAFSAFLVLFIIFNNRYVNRFENINTDLEQIPPKSKVVILTVDIAQGLPLVVQNHHYWSSRFPSLWMLPQIIKNPTAKREIQTYMLNAIYEDILFYKPDYIITKKTIYQHTIEKSALLQNFIKNNYTQMRSFNTLVFQRKKKDL